jgi:hypothetical protein
MKYQTIMVTPEKAKLWLQKNIKNRTLRHWHIDDLAREMSEGLWSLNGQTISFSTDGALLDGQHRLLAVIKSGVTVPMSVAFGVDDPNAFKTYDATILKRNASQIASMMGIENANNISAIARRLLHWDKTSNKAEFSFTCESWKRISNNDVLDYIQTHNQEIYSMYKEIYLSLPARRCKARSALVAALIICNRQDDVATMLFVEGLKTGINIKPNSPIHLLRERLIDPPERTGLKWELEVMALTVKAWNKYLNGKTLKHFRWRQEGDNPEKFPLLGDKR